MHRQRRNIWSTSVNHIDPSLVENLLNICYSSGLILISSHSRTQLSLNSCLGSPDISSFRFVTCEVIRKCLHKLLSSIYSVACIRNSGASNCIPEIWCGLFDKLVGSTENWVLRLQNLVSNERYRVSSEQIFESS